MRDKNNFSTWRALRFSFAWAEVKKNTFFTAKRCKLAATVV